MDGFLPERDCQIIGMITKAEKTLPDDFWAVAVVQEIARLVAAYEDAMTDEDVATLVGIGAYIHRTAKLEMMAGIEAQIALSKASRP